MSIISLITDFGLDDEYAGLMKAVILSINKSAKIIDITHNIDSHDIIQAAYVIASSYSYFPENTIHTIVVDPGVGSDRKIIAMEKHDHIFLAPNNGVLTLLMSSDNADRIYQVENKRYFLKSLSHTFHGRDIFAPVSAHLSKGISMDKLGQPLEPTDIIRANIPIAEISSKHEIAGHIISMDHFGNLITNISLHLIEKIIDVSTVPNISIKIGSHRIMGLAQNYESVKQNEPLAIIGSRGYLEVAVNSGSARHYFNVNKGEPVIVQRKIP